MQPDTSQSTLSPFKGRRGLKRIFLATGHSFSGLVAALRGEAAFRQMLALAVVLLPVAFMLDVNRAERALLVTVLLLGLVVELINSAIEAAIDRISLELHPLSKNAKDMGSAAQMVTLVIIATVWLIVLLG
ncbi:MAG: diacylglycerol kinase [Pseudomonas sp.]|nr:MAG: diacylglycerol kinase [Pseudomonas sp.]